MLHIEKLYYFCTRILKRDRQFRNQMKFFERMKHKIEDLVV